MKVKDFLNKVAHQDDWSPSKECEPTRVWKSNFDNSYMTHVGMEDDLKFLADREITDELTHGVGYSPKDKKWYGWSHRAIFGFEVGSTCEKGNCHYNGNSEEDRLEAALEFWRDIDHVDVRCEGIITRGKDKYYDLKWEYTDLVPNKSLHGTTGGSHHFITPLGRGEWVAETMEDAKQMAIDFNEGVS